MLKFWKNLQNRSNRDYHDHSHSSSISSPNEKNNVNKSPVRRLVLEFAEYSTAHGLSRVVHVNSLMGRSIWAAILLLAFTMFGFQCAELLKRFYSYPKSVQLEVANRAVPFPAVSICNLRPVDLFTIADVFYDENETARWFPRHNASYTGRPDSPFPNFERDIVAHANRYFSYLSYAENRSRKNETWLFKRELLSRMTLAANLGAVSSSEGGVSRDQFIAKCEYSDDVCSRSDFENFLDPAYFNCFTFNLSNPELQATTIYEGPDNGLAMILFVPTMTSLNLSAEARTNISMSQQMSLGGEGIRLVVHQQGTVPYPLTEGLDIPRGMSASVGINLVETERLDKPHGNCTHQSALRGSTAYTYTMASCKKACLQDLIVASCGCADVSLPPPLYEVSLCSQFNELPRECMADRWPVPERCVKAFDGWFSRVQCMQTTRANISKNLSALSSCSCFPRCRDSEYKLLMSLSDWPVAEQAYQIFGDLLHREGFLEKFPEEKARKYFGTLTNDNASIADYDRHVAQRNWMRLNVFISDTSVIRILETVAYNELQLISDVGGQLGLWVGISVITLFELIELLFRLVFVVCVRHVGPGLRTAERSGSSAFAKNANLAAAATTASPPPAEHKDHYRTDFYNQYAPVPSAAAGGCGNSNGPSS